MGISLPRRLSAEWRLKLGLSIVLTAGFGIFYITLQRWPVFTPTEMKAVGIDTWIPFLPATTWVYESIWLLFPIAPWLMNSRRELIRYSWSFILVSGMAFLVFFFFPTYVPRPAVNGNMNALYRLLISIDLNLNAFPSLHVALSVLSAAWCSRIFRAARFSKLFHWFMWSWVFVIALSTLTTRQHVFLDAAAGAGLGYGGFAAINYLGSVLRRVFFPGLLPTSRVTDSVLTVCDHFVNMYIIETPEGLICFDAGWSKGGIERGFASLGLDRHKVQAVFLTHSHWDHARAAQLYPNAAFYAAKSESDSRIAVTDGQTVTVAGVTLKVVSTPGHVPDAVSYLVDGRFLFVGDTLRLKNRQVRPFYRMLNRDNARLDESIRKLAGLGETEWILTSHSGAVNDPRHAFEGWYRPTGESLAGKVTMP